MNNYTFIAYRKNVPGKMDSHCIVEYGTNLEQLISYGIFCKHYDIIANDSEKYHIIILLNGLECHGEEVDSFFRYIQREAMNRFNLNKSNLDKENTNGP